MRKILLIAAAIASIVTATGCAGSLTGQRKAAGTPAGDVPVVTDKPSMSERRQIRRAMEDRQAYKSMTRVDGELTR